MGDKRACVVCGRPFPEGQGVVLARGGFTLEFHSSRCAYRFFKLLFERLDYSCLAVARDLAGEFAKSRASRSSKRI